MTRRSILVPVVAGLSLPLLVLLTVIAVGGSQALAEHPITILLLGVAVLLGAAIAGLTLRASRSEAGQSTAGQLAMILNALPEGILHCDGEGRILYLNQAARRLLGQRNPQLPILSEALQLVDRTSRANMSPDLLADLHRGLPVSLPANACLVSADGMEFEVAGGSIPLSDGAVLTLHDVTEAAAMHRSDEQGAGDAVTGLPPQRLLVERLERNLLSKRAVDRELSYLHIELDGIDRIAQEAGQAVADQALRQAAQVLLSRIRDSDTLTRVGPCSFGLLLPACPREISERLLQTLLASIAATPFDWRGRACALTARIGIVHAPPFVGAYDECQAQAIAAVPPPPARE